MSGRRTQIRQEQIRRGLPQQGSLKDELEEIRLLGSGVIPPSGYQVFYNQLGQVERVEFDDGREIVVVYDVSGKVSQIHTSGMDSQLIYDQSGNLIGIGLS